MQFELPPIIKNLILARNAVRDFYAARMGAADTKARLQFTLDGNFIGDLGEALAAEMFGVSLVDSRSSSGIDGYAPDGKKSVQVKASGTGRGPAFRKIDAGADHLLFFDLNLEAGIGTVLYNGPEHRATACLPDIFSGQRSLTRAQIRAADASVLDDERLSRLNVEEIIDMPVVPRSGPHPFSKPVIFMGVKRPPDGNDKPPAAETTDVMRDVGPRL